MKPTLIIVDDVKLLRDGLRRHLANEFDIVGEADNGETAVELCRKLQPQLVVMDVVMPRMSGVEALAAIRKLPRPHPHIVVLSALSEERIIQHVLELGASDYLVKPVDYDKLRQILWSFARSAA
jgi:two-component system chemotaxis response regulator CheY